MPGIGDLLAQLLVQKAPDILKGLNEAQVQPQQMTQATMSQAPAESRSSAVSPGVGSALQTAREAALKGLKKITEQQIAEAATVMPTEQLAQQIDTVMPDQTQLNQALAGGGQFALPGPETVQPRNFNQSQSVAPQQPQAQPAVVNPEGLLQNLFQRMGFNDQGQFQSGGFLAKTFDNLSQASGGPGIVDQLLKVQELTGQQPLQQGEIDKLIAETQVKQQEQIQKQQVDFFKSINEPLTTTKDLSLVERGLTAIDNINQLLGVSVDPSTGQVSLSNSALLRNKNFLNKNRQALTRARDVYINSVLRRDSGAAIGKEEEEAFKRIQGFEIGMKAFVQNPEVIAKAITESKQQLIRDRARLSPNEQLRSTVQQLRSQGFTDPEIFSAIKRRGLI